MSKSVGIQAVRSTIAPFLRPLHSSFAFPLLDVIGAMRLSSVINWMATGPSNPPSVISEKGNSRIKVKKARATLLQELVGLFIVLHGGETFLCMCTGATPSWLLSPKLALLFGTIHTLQTRTPIRQYLPKAPSLPLELALAIPDAIGRTLLLTRFSILPLLHPTPGTPTLPATTSTLLLVPFILAVPFAAMIFTGTSFFSPSPKFSTPAELQPNGWKAADAWCPILIPVVFLSLIGPVKGWEYGWGMHLREEDAEAVCMVLSSGIFLMRAVYNFGYKRSQWEEMLGMRRKMKTA